MNYTVVIYYDDIDKIYVASIPDLPGCMAHGNSQLDALHELLIARELWIEEAEEMGKEIPTPTRYLSA